MSIWATMSQIDIRSITESKNGFTYLSWSHALRLLKDHAPHAKVVKHTFEVAGNFLPYMLDNSGFAYVMVTVDLGEGDVTTEIMPVLNHSNRPIQKPNSFEVNASLQRCMAKTISMATGLGIHLYAGEDMPRPVEAVGADNSARKTASGGTPEANKFSDSAVVSSSNSESTNSVSGVHKPTKAFDQKQLHHLISVAPDMQSLMELYRKHERQLEAFDKTLFTARKKELELNG